VAAATPQKNLRAEKAANAKHWTESETKEYTNPDAEWPVSSNARVLNVIISHSD